MTETDEIRCPACDARNTPSAPWCTQCYAPLGAEPTPPTPPPPAPPAPTPPPAPRHGEDPAGLLPLPPAPPGPSTASQQPRALQAGSGRFRQGVEGLEWSCTTCDEWNTIERVTCTVCEEPFGASVGADAPAPRPQVAAPLLIASSLAVPGAGHWLLGLRGMGVLRLLLALVWGAGGLSLLLRARASGQPALPAIPLLLGWAVVAAASANDAVVEGGGDGRVVLDGRVLLWLTVAVVGGTLAAAFVGVLSAVGG